MKCDVCGTKIVIGSHECPNCGYKYGQYASHYDMELTRHEHIQYSAKRSFDINKMKKIIGLVIIVFGVGCFVVSVAFSVLFKNKEGLTFQSAIDKGYDNGTVALALEAEQELAKNFSVYDPHIEEYYFKENDRVFAQFGISYHVDGIGYRIIHSFENNEINTSQFEINGYTDNGIQYSNLVNTDVINQIGNYFHYDYAYEDFNEMRLSNQVSGYELMKDNWKLNIYQDDVSTEEERLYYFVYTANQIKSYR